MTDFAYAVALLSLFGAAVRCGIIAFGPPHGRRNGPVLAARAIAAFLAGVFLLAGIHLARTM